MLLSCAAHAVGIRRIDGKIDIVYNSTPDHDDVRDQATVQQLTGSEPYIIVVYLHFDDKNTAVDLKNCVVDKRTRSPQDRQKPSIRHHMI